jgi:2-dehydropantoate 2-reductase
MKIAVIGAGSLGTIIGALLAKGGRDVILVDANEEHVKALNKKGAKIVGFMELTIPVKAITPSQMEGTYDLVIYLVKTTYNNVAFPQIIPHLHEESIVLTLQNGLPEDTVAEYVGAKRTLGAAVGWGATWMAPGVSKLTSPADKMTYDIGELDGRITERLQKVKEILEPAGIPMVTDKLIGIRWTKLLVNSTFSGMSAALGCTYGDVLDSPKALTCVAHIANECLQVVAALGIKPDPIQGIDVGIMAFQNRQQMKKTFNIYQMAFGPHRALKASMLQDLEKSLPCEINIINGKVTEMGRKAGVGTPVNDKVVEIVIACQNGKLKPSMSNLDLFVLPEVPEGPCGVPVQIGCIHSSNRTACEEQNPFSQADCNLCHNRIDPYAYHVGISARHPRSDCPECPGCSQRRRCRGSYPCPGSPERYACGGPERLRADI